MTIILLSVVFAILCNICYMDYKHRKANKRLNEIYSRRRAKEDRRRRLIEEKPKDIIFASQLWEMEDKHPLNYIGRIEKLDRRANDWDLATFDKKEYLRMDGKWYELVDDMPHIDGIRY